MSDENRPVFEGWAVLELMGHRRLGGYVRQAEMFGTAMCRIDVPGPDGAPAVTQFYGGASVYCMTPCSEEAARAVAKGNRPEPVHRFELPAPARYAPDGGLPCDPDDPDDPPDDDRD